MVTTDSLLTTKIYLPAGRSRLVPRPRLLDLLSEGLTRPLTLISAPAGFGKTTLLRAWRESLAGKDYPLAWITLDLDDNDPFRFLLYLVSALQTLRSELGESVIAALRSQEPPAMSILLTSLLNELSGLDAPFGLVLDDYHLITARPVHEALRFLLDGMPPQMHLVLLTRADPPLPLARLRARDQVLEIRLPALRFQTEESACFLNEIMELGLSGGDIAALSGRTEGWIAGLQLAAVSLQQQADRHAFVAAFAGDDRYVMDYLLEEVLQRQSQELQSFLLKTSILERLSGPLCQAVTGQSRSQEILEKLEQVNLFISALDNKRTWYRYHPLFADLLRHRLRQIFERSEWLEFYRRASAWYESEGFIPEAVSQALAAPDHDLAADIMERHVLAVFYRGETMLVHHWLKTLPEAVVRRRALLCAMYANTTGHASLLRPQALAQSEAWLETAEQLLAENDGENVTRSFIGLSRAYLALWKGEDPGTVMALAKKALAGLPPESERNLDPSFQRFRSGLIHNLAISYMALGDEEAANRAYAETQRIGEACGDFLNMYSAIANQSLLLRRHGHLQEAASLCSRAISGRETLGDNPDRPTPFLGVVYACLGRILLEWNELEAAGQALSRGLELSRLVASADDQLESLLGLVWLRRARGDIPGALDLLETAATDSPRARLRIQAMRARLQVAQSAEHPESLEAALRWAEGKTLAISNSFWQVLEPMTLARVQIAAARDAALAMDVPSPDLGPLFHFLDDQLKVARSKALVEQEVELLILQSLAWQARENNAEALESLQEALALAEPGGYVRLFIDEGLPMRRLLARVKGTTPRIRDHVAKLLNSPGWGGALSTSSISQDSLIEPLSARELEVLQGLAEGASNADIARKLFITLNTTKKHVTHIFEKLAVTDRLGAARRARELGLVR